MIEPSQSLAMEGQARSQETLMPGETIPRYAEGCPQLRLVLQMKAHDPTPGTISAQNIPWTDRRTILGRQVW